MLILLPLLLNQHYLRMSDVSINHLLFMLLAKKSFIILLLSALVMYLFTISDIFAP